MLFSIAGMESVTVRTETSRTLSPERPRGGGLPATIVAAPHVHFTSCKVIKSNGLIKTLQHRSNMRLLLFAAAGQIPNAISVSNKNPLLSPLLI